MAQTLTEAQEMLLTDLERTITAQTNRMPIEKSATLTSDTDNTLLPSVKAVIEQYGQHKECKNARLKNTKRLGEDLFRQWNVIHENAQKTLRYLNKMELCEKEVVMRTKELYQGFEHNFEQLQNAENQIKFIEESLPFFTSIDTIAPVFGFYIEYEMATKVKTLRVCRQQSMDPDPEQFEKAFKDIEKCLEYLYKHSDYRDSAVYGKAYRELYVEGIVCLKDNGLMALDGARDSTLQKSSNKSISNSTSAMTYNVEILHDTAHLCRHFEAIASTLGIVGRRIREMHEMLQKADQSAEAVEMFAQCLHILEDVATVYTHHRSQLLTKKLTHYFESIAQAADIVHLFRICGMVLLRVTESEYNLFLKTFTQAPEYIFCTVRSEVTRTNAERVIEEENLSENGFKRLVSQLSTLVYTIVRPQMLEQYDLDTLCEIIQVLGNEITSSVKEPVLPFAEPVFHRMIQDAQERLIFCVQTYVQDEIKGFIPSDQDLDYPEKLTLRAPGTEHVGTDAGSLYATWYPSLERSLFLLSKIYHFVNADVFRELAQEAISECIASLKKAAADITVLKGALHGSLFLIKHLLILQEQITPFDIQFTVKSKALGFASASGAISHIMSSASALPSQERSWTQFLTKAITTLPQVQETSLDAKKDLNNELEKSCATLTGSALHEIAHSVLHITGEIAKMQGKCARERVSFDIRSVNTATPDTVTKALTSLSSQLDTYMSELCSAIHTYLSKSSTERILLQPIQKKLLDNVKSLHLIMEKHYSAKDLENCKPLFARVLQQLQLNEFK